MLTFLSIIIFQSNLDEIFKKNFRLYFPSSLPLLPLRRASATMEATVAMVSDTWATEATEATCGRETLKLSPALATMEVSMSS